MQTAQRLMLAGLILLVASCDANPASENATEIDTSLTTDNALDAAGNAVAPPPAAAESVFCGVINRRISRTDCEDLKEARANVSQGVAAFNVPSPMIRDKVETITLVVDRRSPEEISATQGDTIPSDVNAVEAVENATDIGSQPPEALANDTVDMNMSGPAHAARPAPTPEQIVDPLEGRTETITPKVGQFMRADLTGDGFKIKALNPLSQEIPAGEQATWQWEVIPERGGTHSLTLRTVVEGEAAGTRYQLSGTPTTRTVEVEVSWGGKIADALDATVAWLDRMKVVLLSLAGMLGAAWAVRRAWRGKNRDESEPEPS